MNTIQPIGLPKPTLIFSARHPRNRRLAFTLIELLVVIAIIGVLASLIVGLSGLASKKMRESRIRTELNELVTAIESYHAKFGQYPPGGMIGNVANPTINPLFYELTGTVLNNATKEFQTREGQKIIAAAVVSSTFGVDGFVNTSTDPKQVKSFKTFKEKQYQQLNSGPYVLVVPVPWPLSRPDQPTLNKPGLNPWRYVSKNPTNNPTTFDLWAEYVDGKRTRIICNWSKDILEIP